MARDGSLRTEKASLKRVGHSGVMLTQAEYTCLLTLMKARRQQLLQTLLLPPALLSFVRRLHWSGHSLRFFMQLLVLLVFLPLILLWGVGLYLWRWLSFPFHWLANLRVPPDIVSPGEKNISGIHHAFGRLFDLSIERYAGCVDEWVNTLYSDTTQKDMYSTLLCAKLKGIDSVSPQLSINDPLVRRYLSSARDELSKKLGHYSASGVSNSVR